MIASVIMLIRVLVIASVLMPALLPILLPPMAAAALTFLAFAVWLSGSATAPAIPALGIRSPLDLLGALRMALLISTVILISGLVQRQFGSAGLYAVAAISGIADVDAITISAARAGGDPQVPAVAILIAVATNSLSKAILAAWVGRPVIGVRFLVPSLASIAVAAAVYALT